jgi:hypothetical protein
MKSPFLFNCIKSLLKRIVFFLLICQSDFIQAQSPSWKLWASGLPSGVYPRMVVAPNHDIFYTLLGTGINLGYIYKANTNQTNGLFSALPQIPRPSSIQNNIVALGFNKNSEAIAGIYRTDYAHPWLFVFNNQTNSWDTAKSPLQPSLGGHCVATSKNGTIYVGTRWAYIYKSVDDGHNYEVIDESKLLKSMHPCYYPSLVNGTDYDAAIFSINIDHNGRVYAGTETAGVIYSDDEGLTWHPADLFACLQSNPNVKDTTSPMLPLSVSGNAAALGFTKDNNLVWSGVDMWRLGWKNRMGYADMHAKTTTELEGLPDYLVQTGQQVSKIVTTASGQMFFHSGNANGATQIGIYTSWDGIHWSSFNNGITGQNDGQSQGSLAVDGNKVFMATRDGKVWVYEDSTGVTSNIDIEYIKSIIAIHPNPATDYITISNAEMSLKNYSIYNAIGKLILKNSFNKITENEIDISDFEPGLYIIRVVDDGGMEYLQNFSKTER